MQEVETGNGRLEKSSYFMTIALAVSLRSTCNKRQVGCVFTDGNIILSTGYNGAPKGLKHCDIEGCLLNSEGKCIRCIHAEINAIAQLSNNWIDTLSIWTTDQPCLRCLQAISALNTSTITIHYLNPYNCEDRDLFYESLEANSRRRIFMKLFQEDDKVEKGLKHMDARLSSGKFTITFYGGTDGK